MAEVRVLLVEPEESIAVALDSYFRSRDLVVDWVRSAGEAEARLLVGAYGVLITDLRLGTSRQPEGLALLAYARAQTPSTKAIVLTAYISPAQEQLARQGGADVVLRRPVTLNQLAQTILDLANH